ncbi:MAG: Uma2 family endonuclease [Ktedonobacteraceae bacterium]|nr:Uma2 family endonuclease [Ktedonobacteraceae bacterium]
MATNPRRRQMSFEAYLLLDQNSPNVKYEYIDGYAVAMAGGTLDHSILSANMIALLKQALGLKGPCLVHTSDARVKINEKSFHPDAVVSCDIADRGSATYLSSPHLIVEALSPSTEAYDRFQKFRYYQESDSLQEYVLVNYRVQLVEVFRLTDDEWVYHSYRAGETVELASLDVSFAVENLYAGLDIPTEIEEPPGAVEEVPEELR